MPTDIVAKMPAWNIKPSASASQRVRFQSTSGMNPISHVSVAIVPTAHTACPSHVASTRSKSSGKRAKLPSESA